MTDTNPRPECEEEEELLPELYVEKDTQLLYECKFFDTFVLVRPATPRLYLAIKKLNHQQFLSQFEEFCGNKDEVRDFIHGAEPDFIIN